MTDDALSSIIEALLALKPRAIGFDLYRDLAVPPGTERLNHLLADNPNLVMAEKFGRSTIDPTPNVWITWLGRTSPTR